jgi:hypothetical protein
VTVQKEASGMMRPNENDTVMICKHIWRASSCKVAVAPPLDDILRSARDGEPRTFTRADGTKGEARFFIRCKALCGDTPEREVDYVETRWERGRFQVVDFQRSAR